MGKEILVALDGSSKDERAVAVAAAFADLADSDLRFITVVDDAADGQGLVGERSRSRADANLVVHARQAAALTTHSIARETVVGEDVAACIARRAVDVDALVVVLGTRAPESLELALAGSVADRVMRECTTPVILVPPGSAFMGSKNLQLARILVPLDGSALANQALTFLLHLPHARRLEYVLYTALPDGDERLDEEEIPDYLDAAAARVRARGASVEVLVSSSDHDASRAIAHAVRDAFVELIAMSTRGMSGLRRLALGSVAEGVVRASDVPVLVMTPAVLSRDATGRTNEAERTRIPLASN